MQFFVTTAFYCFRYSILLLWRSTFLQGRLNFWFPLLHLHFLDRKKFWLMSIETYKVEVQVFKSIIVEKVVGLNQLRQVHNSCFCKCKELTFIKCWLIDISGCDSLKHFVIVIAHVYWFFVCCSQAIAEALCIVEQLLPLINDVDTSWTNRRVLELHGQLVLVNYLLLVRVVYIRISVCCLCVYHMAWDVRLNFCVIWFVYMLLENCVWMIVLRRIQSVSIWAIALVFVMVAFVVNFWWNWSTQNLLRWICSNYHFFALTIRSCCIIFSDIFQLKCSLNIRLACNIFAGMWLLRILLCLLEKLLLTQIHLHQSQLLNITLTFS